MCNISLMSFIIESSIICIWLYNGIGHFLLWKVMELSDPPLPETVTFKNRFYGVCVMCVCSIPVQPFLWTVRVDVALHLKCECLMLHQDGGTPLFVACQCNHLEVVEELVSNGADIHCQMVDGASPLFISSQNGHLRMVQYLLGKGAKPGMARKVWANCWSTFALCIYSLLFLLCNWILHLFIDLSSGSTEGSQCCFLNCLYASPIGKSSMSNHWTLSCVLVPCCSTLQNRLDISMCEMAQFLCLGLVLSKYPYCLLQWFWMNFYGLYGWQYYWKPSVLGMNLVH